MYIYELSFSETIITILLNVIIRTVQPHPSLDLVHRNVLFQIFQIITVQLQILQNDVCMYVCIEFNLHRTIIDKDTKFNKEGSVRRDDPQQPLHSTKNWGWLNDEKTYLDNGGALGIWLRCGANLGLGIAKNFVELPSAKRDQRCYILQGYLVDWWRDKKGGGLGEW